MSTIPKPEDIDSGDRWVNKTTGKAMTIVARVEEDNPLASYAHPNMKKSIAPLYSYMVQWKGFGPETFERTFSYVYLIRNYRPLNETPPLPAALQAEEARILEAEREQKRLERVRLRQEKERMEKEAERRLEEAKQRVEEERRLAYIDSLNTPRSARRALDL